MLVLADGDGAKLIETESATLERLNLIDTTRAYYRVRTEGGEPLPGDVQPAVDRAAVALAAELVGVAQRALEMAVAYARERRAVRAPDRRLSGGLAPARGHALGGRGSALAHLLRGLVRRTRSHESLALAASMAKARASDAASTVTHHAIQTLGGIGFTWEHDVHFLLKRARVGAQMLGSARLHRERVAELVGLGPAT